MCQTLDFSHNNQKRRKRECSKCEHCYFDVISSELTENIAKMNVRMSLPINVISSSTLSDFKAGVLSTVPRCLRSGICYISAKSTHELMKKGIHKLRRGG